VAILSAAISASTLDLRRAAYETALSAAISASIRDLLNALLAITRSA